MTRPRLQSLGVSRAGCAFLVFLGLTVGTMAIDLRDEQVLQAAGDDPVWFALHYKPHRAEAALTSLKAQSARFDSIDTVVVHAPASRIIEAMAADFYDDGEIIDDTMIARVVGMLTEVERVSLYKRMNVFPIGVLNISVGAPKQLINRRRSGEKAIGRAYQHVIERLDVPVVASAGNYGPLPGLVNPWAQAEGVIAAASADAGGTRISQFSSRPTAYGPSDRYHLFSAHGENTIGALTQGEAKTVAMLEAERHVDLAAAVGADKVPYYAVRSGTSFAAAQTARLLCRPHQMIQVLGAYMNAVANVRYPVPPFVRGYIDTGIDESHPVFEKRLADKRFKYGGLVLDIDVERKKRVIAFFASNGIDLELRYGHRLAVRFLRSIARPIAGASRAETGDGFLSHEAADAFVRQARLSTLITLLAEPEEDRLDEWRARARAVGDPLLFAPEEAEAIVTYCDKYDLVLALSLNRR